MSRIKMIKHEEATGRLKEIYDELVKKRGKLAEVHTIQSLRPESIVQHMDLYMGIMFSRSELSRAEREMIAVVVSAYNNCTYCQIHHGEAANRYWKDENRVEMLKKDFTKAVSNERELKLCEFAKILTTNPGDAEKNDITEELRRVGLSDSAILDATLVVSYFNFVNRMVLGLDVVLENDSGKGYKY